MRNQISIKEHLVAGGRLEEHIKQWNGLVKLFHNERREGYSVQDLIFS